MNKYIHLIAGITATVIGIASMLTGIYAGINGLCFWGVIDLILAILNFTLAAINFILFLKGEL